MEVVAILDLRTVGIAELFVQMPFCSANFSSLSRSMATWCAVPAPKTQATGRPIGLVDQSDGFGGTASSHFETMEVAFGACLLESQLPTKKRSVSATSRTGKKHGSVEALHRHITADLIRGPPPLRLSESDSITSICSPEG